MPAQLRPVASEILRRIMELSCVAGGEILKFHLSVGGGRDYGAFIAPPRSLNLRAC